MGKLSKPLEIYAWVSFKRRGRPTIVGWTEGRNKWDPATRNLVAHDHRETVHQGLARAMAEAMHEMTGEPVHLIRFVAADTVEVIPRKLIVVKGGSRK